MWRFRDPEYAATHALGIPSSSPDEESIESAVVSACDHRGVAHPSDGESCVANVCANCSVAVIQSPLSALGCRDYALDPIAVTEVDGRVHAWECWQAAAGQEEPPGLTSWQQLFGTPLSSVAPVAAVLNGFEEMVISLVHPLVQLYTIPKTGELAYVGHVCNFRQEVSSFLSSLPVRPADMPFILVRPRAPSGFICMTTTPHLRTGRLQKAGHAPMLSMNSQLLSAWTVGRCFHGYGSLGAAASSTILYRLSC